MKSGTKCLDCSSCLDVIWIMPRRYLHCWLCRQFYDVKDGSLVKLDPIKDMGISNEMLQIIMKDYYEKSR